MVPKSKYSTLLNDLARDVTLIYHYTTKETALEKILQSGKLRLSPLENTNDPRENKYWLLNVTSSMETVFENDFYKTKMDEFNDRMKTHCRIAAFSTDDERLKSDENGRNGYAHSRMWAQYAANHTGVCLIFDAAKMLRTAVQELPASGTIWNGRVQYGISHGVHDTHSPFRIDYAGIDSVDRHIREYYSSLLFEKGSDWQDESEYRIAYYSAENKGASFEIGINESLCGIIVGVDFPSIYNCAVRELSERYRISADHIQWERGEPLLAHPIYDYKYEHQKPVP